MTRFSFVLLATVLYFGHSGPALATEAPIPHNQDQPPGPALSPAEAIARMTVPEGFAVELVAAEPDLLNPVAMCFDERGRVWVTESLEYPRTEPGPGRDRIKILEDTDGDGRADRFTIFAEGLNIPSGIAVGYGGVWAANAPDILFLQDTDGDGRADRQEVVVTGFGRTDTHELPNSLTWGPDGWLYGFNGVFNRSRVVQGDKEFRFTCAMFRIHPLTRRFEIFAEGVSNPWGIAFDPEGNAFVSACVIDHLWHITETGYYERQAGAYPPHTWVLDSIVEHTHQKAAYCGLHYFDSAAYPPEYRERLYMGNIHGGAINVESLERDGSTYKARPAPDFLSANDAWFMPVSQKTGPDGCLYILDWYDRYHCYQDARRDSDGLDRLKGRLYRVRYRGTPRLAASDLAQESDERLVLQLASSNIYIRDQAQRLLIERADPNTRERLEQVVLGETTPEKQRRHALWALISSGRLGESFHLSLLASANPTLRAWGVRAAGNAQQVSPNIRERLTRLTSDPASDVRLQLAIASRKIDGLAAVPLLMQVLAASPDDRLIAPIVWQNLHPLLDERSQEFLAAIGAGSVLSSSGQAEVVRRTLLYLLAGKSDDMSPVAAILARCLTADPVQAGDTLFAMVEQIRGNHRQIERSRALTEHVGPKLREIASGDDTPGFAAAVALLTYWEDRHGIDAAVALMQDKTLDREYRLAAIDALLAIHDDRPLKFLPSVLLDRTETIELRRRVLDRLSDHSDPGAARIIVDQLSRLEPELQPAAIEAVTGRAASARLLLAAVAAQQLPASAVNVNQLRNLIKLNDAELSAQVTAIWGTVRTERSPDREHKIRQIRELLAQQSGNAAQGAVVFRKSCGQCHKIYGEGQEVGPDITLNGRNSWDQLLSNVLDPNLVIGPAYQARTIATTDGRIFTGLLAEESEERIVLKVQGGKIETIPRDEVDQVEISRLSLMPEDLDKQLTATELADLFAFLALDRPPSDPEAKLLSGAPRGNP